MRWMTATGFAFSLALAAAPTDATATLIQIDDRSDTINVLVNGISGSSGTETATGVSFSPTLAGTFSSTAIMGFEILEPGQSAISDLMTLMVETDPTVNLTFVDITFVSDTDLQALTVPPNFPTPTAITETGDFQTIYTGTNTGTSGDPSLTIQFASDVSDVPVPVPEPGSLGLLAAGLLGLGAICMRRKPRSLTG